LTTCGPESRYLVLIVGAVASGKTSLARALAQRARSNGVAAASLDMDDIVEALGDWPQITEIERRLAPRLAAIVTGRLFDEGMKFVTIAGSTLADYEWQTVLENLQAAPSTHTHRVLLRVSVREAVRRAQADPRRERTRDPRLLAELHARIDWGRVPSADIEIDTDSMTAGEVDVAVWTSLFGGKARP
jgi:adenylylsulfate kinase-like enzyme